MNIKEYFYILFFLFFILFPSSGCSNGTKTYKKEKHSIKKKAKQSQKKKTNIIKNGNPNTNNKTIGTGSKDAQKSIGRKSVKPPRFYPDANQMRFDGKKEASFKVSNTQSKTLIIAKDCGKSGDIKVEENKTSSEKNKFVLDKTLPSCKSTVKKVLVKNVIVKEPIHDQEKNSLIEGGLQSSKGENKGKNDEEMSSPDLNKETKDETTNVKDKLTDVTKEPSQAGGTVKKEKRHDERRPKKIELDEKEKLIATGAIAKKKRTDYPTMDDVLSDWDTEKEKSAQTLGKGAKSDKGNKLNKENKLDKESKLDKENKLNGIKKLENENKLDNQGKFDSENKLDSGKKLDNENKSDNENKLINENKLNNETKLDDENKKNGNEKHLDIKNQN